MAEQPAAENKPILLTVKQLGFTLVFEVAADRMECYCTYTPSDLGGAPLASEVLQTYLAQYKIREGLIDDSLNLLLHKAATGSAVTRLLIAQGTPMIPGEEGYINMDVKEPDADQEPVDGEKGVVDHRKVQVFLNVEEGERIGVIIPPGPGTPGVTIHGETIPPLPGRPLALKVGQNVRLGDDGVSLLSEGVGRVCFHDGELTVEEQYTVSGDVDFKVGNIQFKGFVEISGDVLDGFSVQARKGILIKGNVGVCDISSEGNITLCGMSGQGSGSITCGGNINANFLYDTNVDCAGNINAAVEIRNCHLHALGSIRVQKGGLSGGEAVALAGVEAGTLGTVTSLKTRVVAGVHYRDAQEINRLFHELKQLIEQFNATAHDQKDMKAFGEEKTAITQKIQEIRSRVYEQCNPKINVRKRLHEGVMIAIGSLSEQIKEGKDGPLSIIENTIEGGFRYLGMTGLEFKASAIEATFIQQAKLMSQTADRQ